VDTEAGVTPQPASTVVLLRESGDGLEVFLVRRHGDSAFMGGAHVFPGGRVDAGDHRYVHASDAVSVATSRLADVDPATALAFYVAAARETFEEAGLRLPLESLVYFAWWVTPEPEPRRFDTRFFLAAAPPEQVARHDGQETTEGVWMRPADAIASCLRGEITLPPPTWTTLRWLEAFDTMGGALEWARTKPIPRIQPMLLQQGEVRVIVLPGDRMMSAPDGFEARETRFVLAGGRWKPLARDQSA
jgi:8-oxo-dGTP pyrophosphatase MutT (NUDIX family)